MNSFFKKRFQYQNNKERTKMAFAQLVGKFLMLMAVLIFVYFTIWLFGSQYFPSNFPLIRLFPPLEIALYGPLVLLMAFVCFLSLFLFKANKNMQKKK